MKKIFKPLWSLIALNTFVIIAVTLEITLFLFKIMIKKELWLAVYDPLAKSIL